MHFPRIFNSKKWLPQQLRKLSHSGKNDKIPVDKSVLKKEKDKDKDKKNKQDKQKEESEATSSLSVRSTQQYSSSIPHPEEEDAPLEECLELPPPMKPIQDASQIVGDDSGLQATNSGSNENVLTELQEIIREKMVSL
jgi:hypothetical protein